MAEKLEKSDDKLDDKGQTAERAMVDSDPIRSTDELVKQQRREMAYQKDPDRPSTQSSEIFGKPQFVFEAGDGRHGWEPAYPYHPEDGDRREGGDNNGRA